MASRMHAKRLPFLDFHPSKKERKKFRKLDFRRHTLNNDWEEILNEIFVEKWDDILEPYRFISLIVLKVLQYFHMAALLSLCNSSDERKSKTGIKCRKLFLYKSLISLLHLLIIAHTFIYWEITKKNYKYYEIYQREMKKL